MATEQKVFKIKIDGLQESIQGTDKLIEKQRELEEAFESASTVGEAESIKNSLLEIEKTLEAVNIQAEASIDQGISQSLAKARNELEKTEAAAKRGIFPPGSLGAINAELEELEINLRELDPASESFVQARRRVEQLELAQTQLNKTGAELRQEYVDIGSSVAGAFGAGIASIQLFAGENEDLQKTLTTVAQAIAAVETVQNTLNAVNQVASLLEARKAAATVASTAATAASVPATGAAATATTLLGAAVNFLLGPIGLITAGVAALTAAYFIFVNGSKKAKISTDKLTESIKKQKDEIQSLKDTYVEIREAEFARQIAQDRLSAERIEDAEEREKKLTEIEQKEIQNRIKIVRQRLANLSNTYDVSREDIKDKLDEGLIDQKTYNEELKRINNEEKIQKINLNKELTELRTENIKNAREEAEAQEEAAKKAKEAELDRLEENLDAANKLAEFRRDQAILKARKNITNENLEQQKILDIRKEFLEEQKKREKAALDAGLITREEYARRILDIDTEIYDNQLEKEKLVAEAKKKNEEATKRANQDNLDAKREELNAVQKSLELEKDKADFQAEQTFNQAEQAEDLAIAKLENEQEFIEKSIELNQTRYEEGLIGEANFLQNKLNLERRYYANKQELAEKDREEEKKRRREEFEEAIKQFKLLQSAFFGADFQNELANALSQTLGIFTVFGEEVFRALEDGIDENEIKELVASGFQAAAAVVGQLANGIVAQFDQKIEELDERREESEERLQEINDQLEESRNNQEKFIEVIANKRGAASLRAREDLAKEKEREVELQNQQRREITLQKQIAAETARIKTRQAKAEKAANIAEAVANTAVAVTSALTIPPPFGQILAAIVGALGAVQIANITAQPIPQFKKGGFTSKGRADEEAGVVHKGEWVAPKWMVNSPSYSPVIQSLEQNRMQGFQSGGFTSATTNISDNSQLTKELQEMNRINAELARRPVVVNVRDITSKQENVKKVQSRASL